MADNLTIKELTQEEVDAWLKEMYSSAGELLENFKKAFQDQEGHPIFFLSREKVRKK